MLTSLMESHKVPSTDMLNMIHSIIMLGDNALYVTCIYSPFINVLLFIKVIVRKINVREYRRDNQNWTIQRNCQHRVHNTTKNKTKTQHNMC